MYNVNETLPKRHTNKTSTLVSTLRVGISLWQSYHTTLSGCSVLPAGCFEPPETSSAASPAETVRTIQHCHHPSLQLPKTHVRCPKVLRQSSHKGVQNGKNPVEAWGACQHEKSRNQFVPVLTFAPQWMCMFSSTTCKVSRLAARLDSLGLGFTASVMLHHRKLLASAEHSH